jgi:hypothetical protein
MEHRELGWAEMAKDRFQWWGHVNSVKEKTLFHRRWKIY